MSDTMRILDPADGSLVGELDVAGPNEVDQAVATAVKATMSWARTSPAARAALVHEIADHAGQDLPESAVLEEWGGQAVVLPYLDGRSTTRLVRNAALNEPTSEEISR